MILTARDIAQQLAARAADYARWLLPNGHMNSGNWCVGSTGGEAGDSLRIQVTGSNAGIWADFAGDDRGDLLNLTASVKGVKLGEAIRIAKDWLGIREPQSVGVPKKQYPIAKPKHMAPVKESSPILEYLAEQRGIDIFTQEDFRIQESSIDGQGPAIGFPSYSPEGSLLNLKRLAIKRDERGKKIIRQEIGCAPSLFGWQALPADARSVVVTEGEIDAMTWHQVGFPAMSIPDGAKGDTWVDYEWDNLQRFDILYLNWDSDSEGQNSVKEFARRLGYHRCLIVKLTGYKDANEALQASSAKEFFEAAIAAAKPITPEQIKTPLQAEPKVYDRFHPPGGRDPGFYSALFDGKLGMRPAEVSVWSGFAGHGKSSLLSQLILEAMHVGFKAAVASMEMRFDRTLHRMVCQAQKNLNIDAHDLHAVLDWMTGKLWLYDVMGNIQTKTLMDLMEYSYARHGVQIFVIDSLMKCSVGQDDYDGQRVFLNTLCSFAEETNTHINLVAHSRKGNDEMQHPGKMDVLGSSSIINQAANILVVCRNKEKEEFNREHEGSREKEMDSDSVVYCNKQRENGLEFRTKLQHLREFFRFEKWAEPGRPVPSEQYLDVLRAVQEPVLIDESATEEELFEVP